MTISTNVGVKGTGVGGGSTGIVEVMKTIAQTEVHKVHIAELGVITGVHPHSSSSDKNNYECDVELRDKNVILKKVPVATQHIGLANIPHIGDLVLVTFINGDINSPVIIGRLYNDDDRPPVSKEEEIIYEAPYGKSDSLRRIEITLPKDGQHTPGTKFTINDEAMSIHIVSSSGECKILLDSSGIKLQTNSKVDLQCDGELSIDAKSSISVNSNGSVSIKGATVSLKGSSGGLNVS